MCWFAALGALATGTSTAGASAALAATQTAVGASLTATVGSAAAGIIGQTQQARQQRKYQAAASEAEQVRLQQQLQAQRIKQDQEMQARQSELFAIQQRAKASVARATVAAGEAGVSGSSVDLLLDDYYRQMGNYQYALTREQGFQDVAYGFQTQSAITGSQQTQIGINRPVNAPSFLEAVTSIGAAIPQGMAQGYTLAQARGGSVTTTPSTATMKADTAGFLRDRY